MVLFELAICHDLRCARLKLSLQLSLGTQTSRNPQWLCQESGRMTRDLAKPLSTTALGRTCRLLQLPNGKRMSRNHSAITAWRVRRRCNERRLVENPYNHCQRSRSITTPKTTSTKPFLSAVKASLHPVLSVLAATRIESQIPRA